MSTFSKSSLWIRRESGRIRDAMDVIGREEVELLRRTISEPYPPPSAPLTPPHRRTGDLRLSIDYNVTASSAVRVAITFLAREEYAKYLEWGTEHMTARPFMRPHRERFRQRFLDKLRRKLAAQG